MSHIYYNKIKAKLRYLLIKVKKQARFCKNKKIYFNQISKWINPLFVTFVTCPI